MQRTSVTILHESRRGRNHRPVWLAGGDEVLQGDLPAPGLAPGQEDLKVPSPIFSPRLYEVRSRVEKTLRIPYDTGMSWSRGEEGLGN